MRIVFSLAVLLFIVFCFSYNYLLNEKDNTLNQPLILKKEATLNNGGIQEQEKIKIIKAVLKNGTSFYQTLIDYGVEPSQVHELIKTARPIYDLSKVKIGDSLLITMDKSGNLDSFNYYFNLNQILKLSKKGQYFNAQLDSVQCAKLVYCLSGVINENLWDTIISLNESSVLALAMSDIFAWDIDFIVDLRKGDQFRIIFEKFFAGDRFIRYGKILSAEFINQGKAHYAIYFQDKEGTADYYDLNGKSLRKQFLISPLNFRRITSYFSSSRFHPIYKRYLPHLGVDYSAPSGTPVVATANGTVTFAGRKGANGNLIILKHNNDYSTYYLHLSGFAHGIKKSRRVTQGQVIGYVGSTGASTGPHLDYRILCNSRFVNPLKIQSPPAKPVKESYKSEFMVLRNDFLQKFSLIKNEENSRNLNYICRMDNINLKNYL